MTFGEALEACKLGKKIQRAGWNGKGMWVEYRPSRIGYNEDGSVASVEAPYLAMKAVPPPIPYLPYLSPTVLYFVPGWLASQTDMLADDWAAL
jgi:hypothetical protein